MKEDLVKARVSPEEYRAFKEACGITPMSAVIRQLINEYSDFDEADYDEEEYDGPDIHDPMHEMWPGPM